MPEPAPLPCPRKMRLFLRQLAVQCRIGIHDFERLGPQRVLVDIDVWVSRELGERAGRSDMVGDTLDYDRVRELVHDLAGADRYNTQEAFCWHVLQACMSLEPVRAARVATSKPDVYPDAASVGIELYESKEAG